MMHLITGSIPLRHLVYRVLDLPLSMQPLLYDFGQVSGKTEDDYITQIVTNHVRTSWYCICKLWIIILNILLFFYCCVG